jgi:hypothetical protein
LKPLSFEEPPHHHHSPPPKSLQKTAPQLTPKSARTHESGKYFAHLEIMDEFCKQMKQSHDIARNAICSAKKCMIKYLLLCFPENFILLTRVFLGASKRTPLQAHSIGHIPYFEYE